MRTLKFCLENPVKQLFFEEIEQKQ